MRRRRHQKGSVCLRSGNWYVRYYGTDGKQRNEFLAEKDDRHHSKTCKPVKDLAAKAMSRVNAEVGEGSLTPKAAEFWESVYLPHCERSLRPSTVHSYKDLWERFLKAHLGQVRLSEYKANNATEFLTSLSGRLGRNSLSHVRSLLSGFFSHATALGKIEHNPIRDAKVLSKPKAPAETGWYDLGQLEDIVSSLKGDTEAQLVVLLAGVMGLRPSEIVGLDWSDFSQGSLHIRRAVVRGVSGGTKTASSVASIPVIQPVLGLLGLWHESSGRPDQGWVFPNKGGTKPMNIRDFTRKRVKPVVGQRWLGLYAGRRGAASILTQLTGSPIAASQLLRHSNSNVTWKHYIKSDRSELATAMSLLETKLGQD